MAIYSFMNQGWTYSIVQAIRLPSSFRKAQALPYPVSFPGESIISATERFACIRLPDQGSVGVENVTEHLTGASDGKRAGGRGEKCRRNAFYVPFLPSGVGLIKIPVRKTLHRKESSTEENIFQTAALVIAQEQLRRIVFT